MFVGVMAIAVSATIFELANNAGPQVTKYKKDHPLVSLVILLIGIYLIIYLLNGIVVFIFGVLLPISGRLLFSCILAFALEIMSHFCFFFSI